MKLFIVTWILHSVVPTQCPDWKPDKYGQWPSVHCAVNHFYVEVQNREAEFKTFKEAKEFVDGGKQSLCDGIIFSTCLSDFKIEELP